MYLAILTRASAEKTEVGKRPGRRAVGSRCTRHYAMAECESVQKSREVQGAKQDVMHSPVQVFARDSGDDDRDLEGTKASKRASASALSLFYLPSTRGLSIHTLLCYTVYTM